MRAFVATLLIAAAAPGAANAALSVSSFSVTPSTTQAGGHPDLNLSFSFGEPGAVKDVALHLPPGLSANPRAIPFCSRARLVRNLCPPSSKVGSLTVTAVAYGFEVPVARNIYNASPIGTERMRLGVYVFASSPGRPGIAAELPAVERPGDRGLDMTVTGLPSEVGGIPVRLKNVTAKIRGLVRVRIKRKVRQRPFVTNPLSCTPATSLLAVTPRDAPTTSLTSSSSFTPSGC